MSAKKEKRKKKEKDIRKKENLLIILDFALNSNAHLQALVAVMEIFRQRLSSSWQHFCSVCQSIVLSAVQIPHILFLFPSSIFLFVCSFFFCIFISINLFWGLSVIHLPSREVFPEGKLLWRPAWPRTASDWPSACLPFCILHCLFNKEQSECDFQGRVPVIVALTPCLSNDPHYGAPDSSLKGLIYEYAGTAAPQASTHQPVSTVSPFLCQHPQTVRTWAWAFVCRLCPCTRK